MGKSPIQRLARLTHILRSLEHHLTEESKQLLKQYDEEYKGFSSKDLGYDEAKKIRKMLYAWKRDLEKKNFKAAGKDLEKVLDEIAAIEEQLGKD